MKIPGTVNRIMLLSIVVFIIIFCNTNNGQINTGDISLPPGFRIDVYADVPNARSMALSENGILFVGTRSSDKVYAIVDDNSDFKADDVSGRPVDIQQLTNGSLLVSDGLTRKIY